MSTPALHQPLRTATGIFDDIELYADQLVIRHRDILSRLREQAEILDLADIQSIRNYRKRDNQSNWIQMKITCHQHTPVEVSYSPSERPNVRALTEHLSTLLGYSVVKKTDD